MSIHGRYLNFDRCQVHFYFVTTESRFIMHAPVIISRTKRTKRPPNDCGVRKKKKIELRNHVHNNFRYIIENRIIENRPQHYNDTENDCKIII